MPKADNMNDDFLIDLVLFEFECKVTTNFLFPQSPFHMIFGLSLVGFYGKTHLGGQVGWECGSC